MTNKRRNYSPAEELSLTTQVEGICPLCGKALFYTKKVKSYKGYELAHIYPLNPSADEIEELKNEERLHEDVNHPDNLIPLCLSCHGKFDKPRTASEYQKLAELKKSQIRKSKQQEIQIEYQLEDDIRLVIDGLYSADYAQMGTEIEYESKSLKEKFTSDFPSPIRQKIKHNVADYYQFVKSKFAEIEQDNPNSSVLIFSQVKSYYLKQKSLRISQQEIFSNIVDWFFIKTKPQTIEAAEIVTSFFIQNCEVF
ncbi:HNH endonuclease [Patescibacteria group bacterium]|nr:HNH endonuclease [Patescibacteria group bacterium]